jgi:hypothetical protein
MQQNPRLAVFVCNVNSPTVFLFALNLYGSLETRSKQVHISFPNLQPVIKNSLLKALASGMVHFMAQNDLPYSFNTK